MDNLYLSSLSEILATEEGAPSIRWPTGVLDHASLDRRTFVNSSAKHRYKAQREWYSAIQALNQLLTELIQPSLTHPPEGTGVMGRNGFAAEDEEHPTRDLPPPGYQGFVLSGLSPVLTDPDLAQQFATHIFTLEFSPTVPAVPTCRASLPLLPASEGTPVSIPPTLAFPLLHGDPLAKEQFCVVLTSRFSLAMVLGEAETGMPIFRFSFDPDIVQQALWVLRSRVLLVSAPLDGAVQQIALQTTALDSLIQKFPPIAPHYKTVMAFSRLLLQNLPVEEEKRFDGNSIPGETLLTASTSPQHSQRHRTSGDASQPSSEVELLQAIAHEVRTPLATIRTLTRLLLKRPQFDADVVRKRLEMIDQECTTQIDRFNLIFRAVELELSKVKHTSTETSEQMPVQLTIMSVRDVLQNSLPRWQKQASQHNHTLELILPQKIPTVVSDPTMLDQVLTGVIENFTRSLPSGSHIQVGVSLAGHQLKLQLESLPTQEDRTTFTVSPKSPLKSIGPLLMFQPETGSLSLNMNVTKNLFQAIGGKLVVRQRPQQGKVMTIFLPLQISPTVSRLG